LAAVEVVIAAKDSYGVVRVQPVETGRRTPATLVRPINVVGGYSMLRDIDYAATAVKTAIVEKFGRAEGMDDLQVVAHDKTISIQHGERSAEGTRDSFMSALHKVGSYDQFWKMISVVRA
jgi:hypothetical protein